MEQPKSSLVQVVANAQVTSSGAEPLECGKIAVAGQSDPRSLRAQQR
jgi:hypothetical protein